MRTSQAMFGVFSHFCSQPCPAIPRAFSGYTSPICVSQPTALWPAFQAQHRTKMVYIVMPIYICDLKDAKFHAFSIRLPVMLFKRNKSFLWCGHKTCF